jgi:hypothetical protein
MRAMRGHRFGWFVVVCVVIGIAGAAAADDLCEGYSGDGLVTRLDGPNAVIKGTLGDLDEVRAFLAQYETDVRAVLDARGLAEVGDELLAAFQGGAVAETVIEPGDTFEWMMSRKKGQVTSFGPLCMAGKKTYAGWTLEVTESGLMEDRIHTFVLPAVCGNLALAGTRTVVKPPIPPPIVKLDVDRDCDAGVIRVDTTGSADDVEVTMTRPDGTKVRVTAGEIADPGPFTEPLVFEAVASNTSRAGETQTKLESRSVGVCPALPPSCQLTVSSPEVWVRGPFTIESTGHWVTDGFALRILDAKEREIERHVPSPELPYTTRIGKPGRYYVQGGATNEVGETWGCQTEILVRPRWNLRPRAVVIGPTNRTTTYSPSPGDTSTLEFGTGYGAELDIEYHASRLIGLELGGVYGEIDTTLTRNLATGAVGSDSVDHTPSMVHLALNFHLSSLETIDFFIGPVVAWVSVDDGRYHVLGDDVTIEGESKIAYGGQMAIDVPLGKATRWAFNLGLRYLMYSNEENPEIGEANINPFVAGIGLSYGF